eukprot:9468436-Pyramimonas_sp.AAC.1
MGPAELDASLPEGKPPDGAVALPAARRSARNGKVRLRDWHHHEQVLPFLRANHIQVRFAIELFFRDWKFLSCLETARGVAYH